MDKNSNNGRLYSLFEKIEIKPGSSGSFRMFFTTKLLGYRNFKALMGELLPLIRAPSCVEADYEPELFGSRETKREGDLELIRTNFFCYGDSQEEKELWELVKSGSEVQRILKLMEEARG